MMDEYIVTIQFNIALVTFKSVTTH